MHNLTQLMQWGEVVPSGAKATTKIVSLRTNWSKSPPWQYPYCMEMSYLWQLCQPHNLYSVAPLHWSTVLLYLAICQHHTSFLPQSPPRTGTDQSCTLPWRWEWPEGYPTDVQKFLLGDVWILSAHAILEEGLAEQDYSVLKACSILQGTSIVMMANLLPGLYIPCNFA